MDFKNIITIHSPITYQNCRVLFYFEMKKQLLPLQIFASLVLDERFTLHLNELIERMIECGSLT